MTDRRTVLGYGVAAAAAATLAAFPTPANAQGGSAPKPAGTKAAGTPASRLARVTTKDGTELFVKDWGSGRTVVLTHAWPLSSDCWDYHACMLADAGFRVIAYDRRGFGRSSQPSGGYDYDTFADDLAAVIDAAGAKDIALVGYSMGGGEVVRYLSRHGAGKVKQAGLVGSVVAGLPKTKANPEGIDAAAFDDLKGGLRKDRAAFLAGLLRDTFYDVGITGTQPISPEVLAWSQQMAMQAGLRGLLGSVDAFGKTDFRSELSAVTVPTLILHGTADKPVPIGLTAQPAAKAIQQAKLVEYPGASHGILVSERDRVTSDLMSFLKS